MFACKKCNCLFKKKSINAPPMPLLILLVLLVSIKRVRISPTMMERVRISPTMIKRVRTSPTTMQKKVALAEEA